MAATRSVANCAFCEVVRGETPSVKFAETELSYAFLALPPLTEGHALIIPKVHAAKMHELSDEYLADIVAVAKRIAIDQGLVNYNIIQNNGRVAYQSVDHVHFHVIVKPDRDTGLVVNWPPQGTKEEQTVLRDKFFERLGAEGKTTCEPDVLNRVVREVFGSQ